MNNIFSWLLKRFMAAFALLVVVQLILYIAGISLILSGYQQNQLKEFETAALEILFHTESFDPGLVMFTGPFFVFSAEKELVFSNKGKGRSISIKEYRPVFSGGVIAGYYHAGEVNFTDNQANRVFLVSIIILSGLSIVLSVIIGLLFAFFNSRKISEPVGVIRRDIHDIRLLKDIPERGFDITEFAEISTDVSNVSRALCSQEDYKRQWLRDLAHDLRTPLSGLKSQFEAIADGVLEATPERFRRHLLEIERLELLARSIGELTSIEEKESTEKTAIDSKQFIDRLTAPFESEIANKKIDLNITVEAEKIYGDENLLLRGIGNIFANAVNYIEKNGRIWIKITVDGIEIANDGPDIPEEQLDLIFTRLFRGDSARSTPGSGLGLSITREIINLHGGEIRVKAFSPRGVRFIVKLPE